MSCVKSRTFFRENLPVDLPIFYQPFYLDIVARGNWEVTSFCLDNKIVACMPYAISKEKLAMIRQPPFTIYQGPFFSRAGGISLSLGKEMEILDALEESLGKNDYYNQNWHPSSRNWLPFHWKGYIQSTRYSYVIQGPREMKDIRQNYSENVKRNLRKSYDLVQAEESDDSDALFDVIGKTFGRKNLRQPYDHRIFRELIRECQNRKCCSVLLARGRDGAVHAGMFLIWDDRWVYYLAGGVDDKLKKSGAMTLLFDRAIQFAMETGRSFDFEGSMIQSIEKYFRSFGAIQQEYFVVTKVNSAALRVRFALGRFIPFLSPIRSLSL